LKVKGNTRESDSRIWKRTKDLEPIETSLTTHPWLEGEVDRRKEKREEALLAQSASRRGAAQGKPIPRKQGTRKETSWVGTRTHILMCALWDQKRETIRPVDWLTEKRRRKVKLRTEEEAVNFITWKRPQMITGWARGVNLPSVLQNR